MLLLFLLLLLLELPALLKDMISLARCSVPAMISLMLLLLLLLLLLLVYCVVVKVDISISNSIMLVILYIVGYDRRRPDRHWLSNAPLDWIGALDVIITTDT